MNTAPQLKELRLDEIRPSKTNPRKDFASPAAKAYLAELAETIKAHGVKQPPLVRPDYCLGTRTRAEIEAKRREAIVFHAIVCGECRLRASELAEKETMPCVVEELTDDDALEIQQIENLQRRDLTPLEEAQGFDDMLKLKNDDGGPRYTVETLAAKVGRKVDWVYKRCELLKLPETARQALLEGSLPPKTAGLIASVPNDEARAKFAKEVLKPQYNDGPLTFREAKAHREAHFMKSLKGAPFALDDATLVPAAGACAGCPKMSANCPHYFDGDDKAHLKQRICLDPTCHQTKMDALFARQAEAAKKDGKTLLPTAEAAKIFPNYYSAGEMSYSSPYVDITGGKQPKPELLKKEVKKAPSWMKLIEEAEEKTGAKVPRIVAPDQAGKLRELVDLKLAIAAIEKSGETIFRSASERGASSGSSSDAAWRKQREAEKKRREQMEFVGRALLTNIAIEMASPKRSGVDLWPWVARALLDLADFGTLEQITKQWGVHGGKDDARSLRKLTDDLSGADLKMLVVDLLVSPDLGVTGTKTESLQELCALFGVDAAKVEKDTLARLKAAPKPHVFVAGDVVEWESGGPGKKKQGVILTPAEWQKEVGEKWKPSKAFKKSVPVRITKSDTPSDLEHNTIDAAGLTLVAAAKDAAQVTPAEAKPAKTRSAAKAASGAKDAKKTARATITDDTRSEVRKLVHEGYTGAEIAKKVGISLPSVQNIKKALGFVKAKAEARAKEAAAK